jgi:hypothetical protein
MPPRSRSGICARCKGPATHSYCKPCQKEVNIRWRVKNGRMGLAEKSDVWTETIKLPIKLSPYTSSYLEEQGISLTNCKGCGNAAIIRGDERCHRCEGRSRSKWHKYGDPATGK